MRRFVTAAACVLALAFCGTVLAQSPMGGCSQCAQGTQQMQQVSQEPAPTDQFRKFQLETLDLRQDMMLKRFEMQRENLKGTPNVAKIAALKAEVNAIQARISSFKVQSGLTDNDKRDGECFKMDGSCFKQDGMGGCSKPGGMGGCNGQPCGQK